MANLIPTATYTSPAFPEGREFHPGDGPHSTNGKTTQISEVVLKAGGEDRDRPSAASDTALGQLRARLTTVQDQLNGFLTERMKEEKASADGDIERRLLDEGVDEDSD